MYDTDLVSVVRAMVAVGEESGNLDEMLSAISEHYDAEVAYAVKRLSEALGPIMRLEIVRATGDGAKGLYTVKVWIDPTGTGNDDVTADYTAEAPQVSHTDTLAAADHAKLATVYFGWTEGTGGSNQTVAIHDFALDFRR